MSIRKFYILLYNVFLWGLQFILVGREEIRSKCLVFRNIHFVEKCFGKYPNYSYIFCWK